MTKTLLDVLVCYDVETVTPEGRRRLHRVARACLRYGQRVQDSVFECRLSAKSLERLKARLRREMDPESDSVRLYRMVGRRSDWLEIMGVDRSYDPDGPLVFGANLPH